MSYIVFNTSLVIFIIYDIFDHPMEHFVEYFNNIHFVFVRCGGNLVYLVFG
jgi:hypothetical protein